MVSYATPNFLAEELGVRLGDLSPKASIRRTTREPGMKARGARAEVLVPTASAPRGLVREIPNCDTSSLFPRGTELAKVHVMKLRGGKQRLELRS